MVEIKNVATTSCTHCAKKFEFEAADAGFSTQCPYCGLETLLTNETPKAPEPPPKPVIKASIRKGRWVGGVEGNLDTISDGILAIGIVGGVLVLIGAFIMVAQDEMHPVGLLSAAIAAAFMMVQGWVLSVLMKAAGEIIRLLKKQNGLQFAGKIKEPTQIAPTCSKCEASVSEDKKECSACGAVFEW